MNFRALPPLTIKESFKCGVKKTFKFSGRSRRSEFCYFLMIICLEFIIFTIFLNEIPFENNIKNNKFIYLIVEILIIIKYILLDFQILVLISLISSMVRRLHDVGKSCWYFLLIFIPLFGLIYIFDLLIQDSFQEANKFGDSPKYQNYRTDNLVNDNARQIIELNQMEQLNNKNLSNPQILRLNQNQLPIDISINSSSNLQIINNKNQFNPPLVPNEDNQPGIYMYN